MANKIRHLFYFSNFLVHIFEKCNTISLDSNLLIKNIQLRWFSMSRKKDILMKKLRIILGSLFTIIAIFAFLKALGLIDTTTLQDKLQTTKNSATSAQVVDKWVSVPFGNAKARITVNLYDDNTVTQSITSEQKNFTIYNKEVNIYKLVENINELSYNDIELFIMGCNPKNHENYCGIIIPSDCSSAIFNKKKCDIYEFKVENKNYNLKGKICLLTYPQGGDNELILVDKKGNEHIIK